jgi:hypothetical protein
MRRNLVSVMSLIVLGTMSSQLQAASVDIGFVQGPLNKIQIDFTTRNLVTDNGNHFYYGLQLSGPSEKSDVIESNEKVNHKLAPLVGFTFGTTTKIAEKLEARSQITAGKAGFYKSDVYISGLNALSIAFNPGTGAHSNNSFQTMLGVQWVGVLGVVQKDQGQFTVEPYVGSSWDF